LHDFNVALLQLSQAPADIPGLAFTEHDEEECGHKNMFRAAIDKNNVVIGAEFPTQMGSSNHTSATATKDYDSFPSIQRRHGN
jgi:hypothetical protein